jgi:hypothetical protein
LQDPISKKKKKNPKRAGGVAQGVGPELKKKKKKDNLVLSEVCFKNAILL